MCVLVFAFTAAGGDIVGGGDVPEMAFPVRNNQ